MAEYIEKSALVAEIERLDALYHTSKDLSGDLFIQGLFGFIDTIEVKEVDLESEVEKCLKKYQMLAVGRKDFTDIAKHFFELAEDHAMLAGMEKMKEQMMAEAIDVEVKVDAGGYPYIPQMELYDYDKDIPLAKAGDKYKVVLIKKN